jgi:DNA N-6-adenine-methyltransferase (Dam)
MAEFENAIGQSDEWYTPPEIFQALTIEFDLDPCSPGVGHWVPAKSIFTKQDDGLRQTWRGTVFMNPPFGGRMGHVPWLRKFLCHGNGIAIVRAYTSSSWFHDWAVKADAMLFPRGKTKFIRPDGTVGESPGHGIVLLAMGHESCEALRNSQLGLYVPLHRS